METLTSSLVGFAGWLLRASWQASVLIGLVLLAQWLLQKRLPPRWRYGLWLLVLIRLLLPVSVGSPFSIFNYANTVSLFAPQSLTTPASLIEPLPTTTSPSVSQAPLPHAQPTPTAAASSQTNQLEVVSVPLPAESSTRPGRHWSWPLALSLLWLAGALFLTCRILRFPFRLNAQLAQHETAAGPAVFDILEQAKRLVGLRKVRPVVQSRAVKSPALMGFIRPWLLLPHGMVEGLTPQELRFVFLHELAHLKRRDIAVNWLRTVLQVLHWFNPLIWYAFSRMRADRELACDELALSFAPTGENKSYGQVIIKLLEGFTRPAAVPGLVGILEDKQHMKRRIAMIAQFKQLTQWPAVAFVLMLTLGLMTLTDAQSGKTTPKQPAKTATQRNSGSTVKTVLAGGDEEMRGIISPDESKIAYAKWKDNGFSVAIKEFRTGRIARVSNTDTNYHDHSLLWNEGAWSPDSKRIAYSYEEESKWFAASYSGEVREDLRIVSANGGEPKILKPANPEMSFYPHDWSRDGKYLLCGIHRDTRRDPSTALATVSVESGAVRQLISFPSQKQDARHPRFSPDGKYVVFARTEGDRSGVFVLAVGGSEVIRLADSAEDDNPIWFPDGKYVLFSSNRRGTWDLWAIAVKDGKPVDEPFPIKFGFANCNKRMTASGKLCYYIIAGKVKGLSGFEVYSVAIAANGDTVGAPKLISKSFFGRHAYPMWSPDGKRIAYGELRPDGTGRLCIQSLADGREERLEKDLPPSINRGGYWAPDGKSMALIGIDQVFLLSLETGEIKTVSKIRCASAKGFSTDGKEFIIFQTHNPYTNQNLAIDLATGATRAILFPESSDAIGHFDVSPDQKRIVYITSETNRDDQRLVVADIHFKDKKAVLQNKKNITNPVWSPDGSKIAYNDGQKLRLIAPDGSWQKAVNTGKKKRFDEPGGPTPPVWSPDGTQLAFTSYEDLGGEIGVMENYMPKKKLTSK